MAVTINTLEAVRQYLEGVAHRSDEHARNVQDVALTLVGAVFLRATGEIEARAYKGRVANMLWFHVGEERYVLAYNHHTHEIELRERNQQGPVLASFTNDTPAGDVRRVFMSL